MQGHIPRNAKDDTSKALLNLSKALSRTHAFLWIVSYTQNKKGQNGSTAPSMATQLSGRVG